MGNDQNPVLVPIKDFRKLHASGRGIRRFQLFPLRPRQHKAFLGLDAFCKVVRAEPTCAFSDALRKAQIVGTFRYDAKELDDKLSR